MEGMDATVQDFDFRAAISDLKHRAKRARRARLIIALSIFFSVATAVSGVFYYNAGGVYSYRHLAEQISSNAPRDPGIFLHAARDLLNRAYPDELVAMGERMDGEDKHVVENKPELRADYLKEVDRLVGFYERAEGVYSGKALTSAPSGNDWIVSFSSAAFTFGAIAIVVLLVQIAISFIRYYSQLAELYDAQAGALIASNGDAERAIKFFAMFSPISISFGKLPASLYERAFDAVASLKERNGR